MTVEYFPPMMKERVSAEPSPRAKMELLFVGTHFAQINSDCSEPLKIENFKSWIHFRI